MAAMTTPVAELPTTLAEAHALILAMAEERAAIEAKNSRIASEMATLTAANADLAAVNQAADARIVELAAIVKMLERTLYGTRSERLRSDQPSDEQIAFAFDEIATGVAAIEAELAKAGGKDKPNRAPRPRKEFGAHLERVEIVIEPEVPPGCEGLEKVLIGEDVSKRLDVTPAKFRLIVTRRPKYAYRNRDGVVQAPAPPHLMAFRPRRFSPRSRWPNTPAGCPCIGRKRSMRVTASISIDR
jgi:transposase